MDDRDKARLADLKRELDKVSSDLAAIPVADANTSSAKAYELVKKKLSIEAEIQSIRSRPIKP
jgi:hypothetical protein